MEFSPFLTNAATGRAYRSLDLRFGLDNVDFVSQKLELQGFASILIATLVLLGPTLLLLRRWRVPSGAFTILFGTVAVLSSALHGFEMRQTVLAGFAGGITADLVASGLAGSVSTATLLRVVGAVVPAVLWLSYFGVLAVFSSVGWSVEFWAGITVMSSLAGFALALLMTLEPPVSPPAPG